MRNVIDALHARLVRAFSNDALQRVADEVVKTLAAQRSVLAGEDSGLGNVWLEFAVQVQGEQSIDWDGYKLHVFQTIEGALMGMPRHEVLALALRTPAGCEWSEDPDPEGYEVPVSTDELVDLIFAKVWQLAADWDDDRIQRVLCPSEDDDIDDYAIDNGLATGEELMLHRAVFETPSNGSAEVATVRSPQPLERA